MLVFTLEHEKKTVDGQEGKRSIHIARAPFLEICIGIRERVLN